MNRFASCPGNIDTFIALVEFNLSQCVCLRRVIAVGLDVNVVVGLEDSAFLGVIDAETETTIVVFGRIDAVVMKRFGVLDITSSVGVRSCSYLESVRGFNTIRAMLTVHQVGDPDTVSKKKIMRKRNNIIRKHVNLPIIIETSLRVGRNSVGNTSRGLEGIVTLPDVLDISGFTRARDRVQLR